MAYTKQDREDAFDAMVDDLPEDMPQEWVDYAIDLALDSADAYTEDGRWVDDTPYAKCAADAVAMWHDAERDARDDAGDAAYHRSIDA